jgi:F0F1-type ATP synthase membrane subunit c/vacuolar-type H+-ATPase subunit K
MARRTLHAANDTAPIHRVRKKPSLAWALIPIGLCVLAGIAIGYAAGSGVSATTTAEVVEPRLPTVIRLFERQR